VPSIEPVGSWASAVEQRVKEKRMSEHKLKDNFQGILLKETFMTFLPFW